MVYLHAGTRHRSSTYKNRAEAERFRDILAGDRARGLERDPTGPMTLFTDCAQAWYAAQSTGVEVAQTRAKQRLFLDCHLLPRWGQTQLGQIKRINVQMWVNEPLKQAPIGISRRIRIWAQSLD